MPGLFVPAIVRGRHGFAARLVVLASAVAPAPPCSAAPRPAIRSASARAVPLESQAPDGAGRWIGAADPRRGGTARGF